MELPPQIAFPTNPEVSQVREAGPAMLGVRGLPDGVFTAPLQDAKVI